jgi:phosphoribosyl 1,2-cyclic phosphate phosphodiesterase
LHLIVALDGVVLYFGSMSIELVFLGTGTSVGVPMIGCNCQVCSSSDPRNNRRRTSLYVKTDDAAFLIDTSPDLRQQALDFGIVRVDAILFTHAHADHVLGLDDIRRFNTIKGGVIPAYGDPVTLEDVRRVFHYIGNKPSPEGLYRPLIDFVPIDGPFALGKMMVTPLEVQHGRKMTGYLLEYAGRRIGYVPDCSTMPDETVETLKAVDIMILDALRYRPHPAHLCLNDALALLERIGAAHSYLIHLCHDMDHAALEAGLPPSVSVSYDGLRLRLAGTPAPRNCA